MIAELEQVELEQVEQAIADWYGSPPAGHMCRDDGSYMVAIHDPGGGSAEADEARAMIVAGLPPGWVAEWTGDGDGDTSSLHICRASES